MKEIMTNAESRKNVVKALAEHLGEKAVYAGPPTFAYQVGNITVDREGKIILEDESRMEEITAVLTECGFLGNSKEEAESEHGHPHSGWGNGSAGNHQPPEHAPRKAVPDQ